MPSTEAPSMKEIIKAAENLPPFPDVVWKVVPLIQQMAPVTEIESVIKYDQAITARILSMSQSAYYSRRHSIGTLRDAIVSLGQQDLFQVVMMACSTRYFARNTTGGYDLREGELWEHAVATALAADMLSSRLSRKDRSTVYTAALLHDIGKTVLNLYVGKSYDPIFALVTDNRIPFLDAERHVLGIDHQQLGLHISRQWHFPPKVTTAIGYHHNPLKAKENRDLVALIYVANRIVSAMGIGCGVDGFLQPNEDEVFVQLGITTSMVEKVMADVIETLIEAKRFLLH